MGMLIDGQWSDTDQRRANANGEFVRPDSAFRHRIGDAQFPAESGRYHLFVNAGCPWAYRTLLYRSIKGLKAVVSLSRTQSAAGAQGWTFGEVAEPLLGVKELHEVYTRSQPEFTGRVTVPVLWDLESGQIVNNESAEIIRMFDREFDALPGVKKQRYFTDQHAERINALNERIYADVNNGVYRCGFAQSQAAYDTAFDRLFECLDDMDRLLAEQRYLCGTDITEADWRFFATLVRFDLAYYGQFRCNRSRLVDFENLWPYTRDLYQQPGVAETVDIDAIKGIYYGSRPPGILPKGPDIDFTTPHSRG